MASPTPVLPEVGSTIVPPGFSAPSRSACSTIASAGRSLTLPPGFSISSLATTLHANPSATRLSRTSGVSPIRSISEAAICASGSGRSIARPFGR
jgi:hypothetical protein